jgi:hypothetical protein
MTTRTRPSKTLVVHRVDTDLLRRQVRALSILSVEQADRLTVGQRDALDGVLNLLGAMIDDADA